jgi:hypothetical protein
MNGSLQSMSRSNTAIALSAVGIAVLSGLGMLASCSDPTTFSNQPTLTTPDASTGSSGGGSSSSSGSSGGSSSGSGSSSSSSSGGMPGTSNGCPPGLQPTIDAVTGMTGLCVDPNNVNKDCPGSREWLPNTPPLTITDLFKPVQHPFPECPFYRFGFQNFLFATQPNPSLQDINGNNEAAIVAYSTIDDIFQKSPANALPAGSLAPPGTHRGTPLRSWLGDIRQAGARQIALDQNGHSLYYGIQANQAFVDFVNSTQVALPNGTTTPLATLEGIKYAPPSLSLPPGLVEFKDAWIDIDPQNGTTSQTDFQNFQATFITTQAWLPVVHQDVDGTVTGTKGTIYEDRNHPIQHWVALVAMHVVYTIPGHPEFVWASFQHIDGNGNPDTSGVDPVRPQDPNNSNNFGVDVCASDAGINYLLCKPDTLAQNGNVAFKDTDLKLDEDAGVFHLAAGGARAAVNTYREFPGSKSNSDNPDDDVVSLNTNMDLVWQQVQTYAGGSLLDPNDRRMFYRLVGAQWLDKPAVFALNLPIANDDQNPLLVSPDAGTGAVPIEQADDRAAIWANGVTTVDGGTLTGVLAAAYDVGDPNGNGTDSPFSILGGEERMSSTVMETFTQPPGSFFNCFKCHNTEAVTVQGIPSVKDPTSLQLLKPKLINVSHLFSQFVLEECTFANKLVDGGPSACDPDAGR